MTSTVRLTFIPGAVKSKTPIELLLNLSLGSDDPVLSRNTKGTPETNYITVMIHTNFSNPDAILLYMYE